MQPCFSLWRFRTVFFVRGDCLWKRGFSARSSKFLWKVFQYVRLYLLNDGIFVFGIDV